MEELGIEKSKGFRTIEVLDYIPNSVVMKTILRKATGNVTAISFDSGESLSERTNAFDNFIQIIDGKADVLIDGKTFEMETGHSIIIPAHRRNSIVAHERFKMISTVIKSGYEDVL